MRSSYMPTRDIDLLTFSLNLRNKITADYASLGLTYAQSVQLAELQQAYVKAFKLADEPQTRTRSAVCLKNERRAMLKDFCRQVVRIIQAQPDVSDEVRIGMGLTVKAPAARTIAAPETPPVLLVESVRGRRLSVQVRELGASGRAKPAAAYGATIFLHVGDGPAPSSMSGWQFARSTSRTNFDLDVDPSIPAGTRISLMAVWYTRTGKMSLSSTPVAAHVGSGVSRAA